MPDDMTAANMFDREFLEARRRIIEIAAAFDRIGRAEGTDSISSDPRMAKMSEAIGMLTDGKPDRARRVQMIFSDAYDSDWRDSPAK